MFDGFKFKYLLFNFIDWREQMPFQLYLDFEEINNEIKFKYKYDKSNNISSETQTWRGTFEYYNIVVKEVKYNNNKTICYLYITGSLHKNYEKGHNFKRFYYSDCCKEIKYLSNSLQLDSKKVEILNLEFGVNIEVDFETYEYLNKHLLSYKSTQFDRYGKGKGKHIGYYCKLEEYDIKLYDKSLQNGLQHGLMRFEYRIKEMHDYTNKLGIKTLNDLMDKKLVAKLFNVLIEAWENIYLFEKIDVLELKLTPTLKKILPNADNNRYWKNLHKSKPRMYRDYRKIYKEFIQTYGVNYHAIIRAKVVKEWDCLFDSVSSIFGVMVKSENRRSIN